MHKYGYMGDRNIQGDISTALFSHLSAHAWNSNSLYASANVQFQSILNCSSSFNTHSCHSDWFQFKVSLPWRVFNTCEFSTAAITNCLTVEGLSLTCLAYIKAQIKLAGSFSVWIVVRIWSLQCWDQRPIFPAVISGQYLPLRPAMQAMFLPDLLSSVSFICLLPLRKTGFQKLPLGPHSWEATVLLLSLLSSYSLWHLHN